MIAVKRTVELHLRCDGFVVPEGGERAETCPGSLSVVGRDAPTARRRARAVGWWIVGASRCYCPSCSSLIRGVGAAKSPVKRSPACKES